MIVEWPAYPAEIDILIGIPTTRTVFHYGIEINSLFYNSPQLQLLRNKTGKNPEISLKFFEDQVAHIQVLDPDSGQYFEVRVTEQYAQYAKGISLDTHQKIRAYLIQQSKNPNRRAEILAAKAEIQDRIEKALKHKRMGERKKAHAQSHKTSDENNSTSFENAQQPLNEEPLNTANRHYEYPDDDPLPQYLTL
jgi:putative transposase